ncbi:MAG: L,D-transpeptidase [Actinomycetota bacterium]
MTPPTRLLASALVSLLLLGACSESEPKAADPDSEQAYAETELVPTPPVELEPEPKAESLVATAAVNQIEAFKEPDAKRPFTSFEHPGPFGTPRVFLVREDSGDWLRVLLPMRPNGSEGWVRADDVVLATNPYRIDVDLSEFQVSAFKKERLVLESPAAIGTGGTPTPTGLFYTTILAKPSDPGSPYGKYAYGLSAYSEVLTSFAGGEGQVAIHGTNQPSLIGSSVSHGCVRVDNATITKLARLIPLGTPVRIHR